MYVCLCIFMLYVLDICYMFECHIDSICMRKGNLYVKFMAMPPVEPSPGPIPTPELDPDSEPESETGAI